MTRLHIYWLYGKNGVLNFIDCIWVLKVPKKDFLNYRSVDMIIVKHKYFQYNRVIKVRMYT